MVDAIFYCEGVHDLYHGSRTCASDALVQAGCRVHNLHTCQETIHSMHRWYNRFVALTV